MHVDPGSGRLDVNVNVASLSYNQTGLTDGVAVVFPHTADEQLSVCSFTDGACVFAAARLVLNV